MPEPGRAPGLGAASVCPARHGVPRPASLPGSRVPEPRLFLLESGLCAPAPAMGKRFRSVRLGRGPGLLVRPCAWPWAGGGRPHPAPGASWCPLFLLSPSRSSVPPGRTLSRRALPPGRTLTCLGPVCDVVRLVRVLCQRDIESRAPVLRLGELSRRIWRKPPVHPLVTAAAG